MSETVEPTVGVLSAGECFDILHSSRVVRVGFVVDGRPEVLPYSYRVTDRGADGHLVVIRTDVAGLLARAEPAVCLELDDIDESSGRAWSVVAHGVQRSASGTEWLPEPDPWPGDERGTWRVVEIADISGRRFTAQPVARLAGFSVEWQVG